MDSAWPLLVYIMDCCTSRDTPVLWTHTTHSSHSDFQSLLKLASEHSRKFGSAGEQPGSPEGVQDSPDGAACSPVSLGRDTDGSSEYSPPGNWGGGGGHTAERGASLGSAGYATVQSTPVHPLGQCGGGKDARRSQAEVGAGDEPVTPDVSPLPYTPLSSAEVQGMLKRARKQPRTARRLFQ